MEGGGSVINLISLAILAVVLFALAWFAVRTVMFALGFLSLPLAEALARWPAARRWMERRNRARDAGAARRGR